MKSRISEWVRWTGTGLSAYLLVLLLLAFPVEILDVRALEHAYNRLTMISAAFVGPVAALFAVSAIVLLVRTTISKRKKALLVSINVVGCILGLGASSLAWWFAISMARMFHGK